MASTIEIVSIGSAAAQLQKPVTVIRRTAEALHIQPTFRINDVPHFATADIERIAEHLARRQPTNNR